MTDKSKDERRPARRPSGDAASSSKGVKKFNKPRGFSDDRGANDRARPRAGEDKPRFGGEGRRDERGDRPARRFGDRDAPRGDRPRFEKPEGGEKRFSRPDRPHFGGEGRRDERGDRPARRFGDRDAPRGDRPRFEKPEGGEKRFSRPDRPRFGGEGRRDERGDRPARRFGDRDAPRGDRPRFEKPEGGEKRFSRPDRPRFGGEGRRDERGDRPARRFGDRDAPRGDRPRFEKSEGGEKRFSRPDRPHFGGEGRRDERGDRPARRFGDRDAPRGDRPRFEKPEGGEKRFSRPDRPASCFQDRHSASDGAMEAPERIAKVMARAGVASRRDAEVMIAEGRVSVNSNIIDTPATLIGPKDRVLIDGVPMPARDRTRLWLFHKPRGLVTTARDPEGRPTVFDSLPEELPRVVAIGRLDINTEGLLLLTNDGGLARVLAHPDTAWLRRYRVRAYGEVNQAQLDALRDGITIEGMHYGPVEAVIQRTQGDNVWLTLGLREGKNREVKRILEHLGLRVNRLIRVSFGPFQLGDLGEGALEEVRTRILKDQLGEALAREAGVDFEAGGSSFDEDRARSAGRDARGGTRIEGRFRSREDFMARGPRAVVELAPEYKRDTYEQRTKERAVWRDAETEEARPKGKRVPRRGADAREARGKSGERVHVRAGAVTDPGGRTVKVEKLVAQPKLVERSRRKPRDEAFQQRDSFNRHGGEDATSRGSFSSRPARRFGNDEQGGERRSFTDRANRRDEAGAQDERSRGDRSSFKPRNDKPFGERSFKEREPRRDKPARAFGEKSFSGRPFGAKSFDGQSGKGGFSRDGARSDRSGKRFEGKGFGGKSFSGKPSGGRPMNDKTSGPRPSGSRGGGGSRKS